VTVTDEQKKMLLGELVDRASGLHCAEWTARR
jgi:hypothetical protein